MLKQSIAFLTLLCFLNATAFAQSYTNPANPQSPDSKTEKTSPAAAKIPANTGASELENVTANEPIEYSVQVDPSVNVEVTAFNANLQEKSSAASAWRLIESKINSSIKSDKQTTVAAILNDGLVPRLTSADKAKIDVNQWQKATIVLTRMLIGGIGTVIAVHINMHLPMYQAIQVGLTSALMTGLFAANQKRQSKFLKTSFFTNLKSFDKMKKKNSVTSKIVLDSIDMAEALGRFFSLEYVFSFVLLASEAIHFEPSNMSENIFEYFKIGLPLKMLNAGTASASDVLGQGTVEVSLAKDSEHEISKTLTVEGVKASRLKLMIMAGIVSVGSVISAATFHSIPLFTALNIHVTLGGLVFSLFAVAGAVNFVRVQHKIRNETHLIQGCGELLGD